VIADGEPDDRRLLADHIAGDPDAFSTLVRRHRDRLWAVAIRTLGDPEEAADALQDGLISAFRGAAGYRGDAAVTTWLHRIVVNAALDRIRRRASRPAVSLDGHELSSGHDDHAATVTRLDLLSALARLPEPQRVALVLIDLENLSVAEAATMLGVAEGTVKSRCSRARTAMALMLREVEAAAARPTGRPAPGGPPTGGNRTGPGRVQADEPSIRRPRGGESW
jgi:RNA polymerase sigma-70 factor (ECF subfamily)